MNTIIGLTPGEVDVYQSYTEKLFSGQIPFKDFWFEYPPGLLVFSSIPQIFSISQEHYFLFWILMIVFFIVLSVYLIKQSLVCEPLPDENEKAIIVKTKDEKIMLVKTSGSVAFLALLFSSGIFLIYRYDFLSAFIILLAVISMRHKYYVPAWAFVAFGIFTKLYPVVLVPLLFIHTPLKHLKSSLAVFILSIVMGAMIWTPQGFIRFIKFHSTKSVQIESIQGMIHRSKPIVFEKFSYVYDGAEPNMVFQIAIMSIALFYCLTHRKQSFTKQGLIMVLAFIVSGNIFSPQYLIWTASFIPFLSVSTAIELIGVTFLTSFYFRFYEAIVNKSAIETLILNIRNLWLVKIFLLKLYSKN